LLGLLATNALQMGVQASLLFSSSISLIMSLSFSWVVVRLLEQSQSSSVTTYEEAIGLRAKVVTKIEKGRLGTISYIDKGTILTLPACAEEEETIEKGDEVYISRTDGKMAYVKRQKEGLWR
jgi:membrane-bound ClpP family serine protease